MTHIQFYYDTPDPLTLLWEFVSHAYLGGRKIVIRAEDDGQVQRIDQMLWTRQQQSFLPHVPQHSPLAEQTPVVVGTAGSDSRWSHDDLMFNLAQTPLPEPQRFRMVVEIVGQTEAEKLPARQRWQQYKQLGLPIKPFDSKTRTAL